MLLVMNTGTVGIENAQLMFDWCSWEWDFSGRYGVWDDDFRYTVYSLGIRSILSTLAYSGL